MPPSPTDDLSTLAWVHDELRRSLEQAVKGLRRHWREQQATMPGDTEGADPAVLHQTRVQFHQGAGALAMVEQDEPARVLRAAEAALSRLAGRRLAFDEAAVTTVETAAFAVLDYLKRLIGGKAVSALALFPAYRAAQELAGADRIHPADLWPQPWAGADTPPALPPTAPRRLDADTRSELERGVLALMKGPVAPAARDMSTLFAGLAATDAEPAWPLAAATFEALGEDWLSADVYTKRLASRLLTQVRRAERAAEPAPDLLRRDLLFFCARARPPADRPDAPVPPRLAGVRTAHALPSPDSGDYEAARLGRFDPSLLPLARKRLVTLKDAWSGWAAGESRPFAALVEHGSLVADSVHTLFPEGESLAQTLQAVMLAQGAAPQRTEAPAELAMEVATALLAIEASLDEAELDRPELPDRVRRIVSRLDDALAGRPPGPVEPWMEALYREASDHQTMGSVVQELHTMLGEVEQRIDRHAREPADRQVLVPVPGHLQSIRGVLSVLGLDAAASATARLREDIDRLLAEPDDAPAQPLRLQGWADSLGALGFLVDMLAVQPHLAKSLFRYDPATGLLSPVMGRAATAAPSPVPAQPTALATQAGELVSAVAAPGVPDDTLVRALDDLAQQAAIAESPQMARAAATARQALGGAGDDEDARRAAREQAVAALQPFAPPPPPPPATPAASPWDDDEDMREVFLDEADEVLAQAREALAVVAERPDDLDALTTLRRAFHTLKGSGRMVGLGVFAEAPWAFEQHYNRLLAQAEPRATDALQQASTAALDDMSAWIVALRDTGEPGGPLTATLARAAALGTDALPPPAPLPFAAPAVVVVPGPEPEPLPTAEALALADAPDLPAFPDLADADASGEPPPAVPGVEAMELDLAALAEPTDPPALALPDVTLGDGSDAALPLSPDDLRLDDDEPLSDLPLPRIELADLGLPDLNLPAPAETPTSEPEAQPEPEPEPELEPEPEPEQEPALVADESPQDEPDQYRQIGPVRVSIPLFNIFLNEADEWSRQLVTALAEWAHAPDDAPTEAMVATAHSLAGSSATVGHRELSELARALEHALDRVLQRGHGRADELPVLQDAGEQVRVLLHQFAAGFLKSPTDGLIDALDAIGRAVEPTARVLPDPAEAPVPPPEPQALAEAEAEAEAHLPPPAEPDAAPRLGEVRVLSLEDTDGATGAATEPPAGEGARFEGFDDLQATDTLDPDLFPIFVEEAADLLPRLAQQMRAWCAAPHTPGAAQACLRTLHTLKGSARLAGAMALGEMAHRLEGGIEAAMAHDTPPDAVDALQHGADDLGVEGQRLLDLALGEPPAAAPDAAPAFGGADAPSDDTTAFAPVDAMADAPDDAATAFDTEAPADTAPVAPPAAPIDWSRFAQAPGAIAGPLPTDTAVAASAPLRVRAALLERIVANAGEVSIARARLQADVSQIAGAARDLADNLERLRRQLRDIELQGEVQISTRLEAARSSSQQFDPLELDRYTRFQELTRMMAESVNDVATVQRGLLQSVQSAEDDLAGQARSARMLQDDLLRARMVEFDALSERLYRVVRQAAKDTGRQVRLDLEGTHLEIDRGVLDRLTGCFEHLLRNAIAHGIEPPAQRAAAGKEAVGHIRFAVAQEGHELAIEIRDDGAGLNLPRIRQRALEQGLLSADEAADDAALAAMIFRPGFSTAAQVTEVAGRGVGMDVVRDEVNALGGRIETATAAGRGTAFRLVVPVSTAVAQVVLLRIGDGPLVALPASVVERVHRVPSDEVAQAYARGAWAATGQPALPFFWLGELLDEERPQRLVGRTQSVVTARSASQRVALHVEQVVGQQEAVVKPLGPQLSRLPGLMALSQLATGEVVPVYNPVALAAVYGAALTPRGADDAVGLPAPVVPGPAAPEAVDEAPLVLVVDDSLTVRRVTQRLLAREGWRVALAKDGVDAIDRLRDERPALLLTDIEMPRMDGFDLVRHVRADRALAGLPIIMITSRIAERHREHAMSLGVNHYLGKPYAEDELVGLVQAHAPRPGT